MTYATEVAEARSLHVAQVRYDNLDPEDFGITETPDLEAILAGRQVGPEADAVYDCLDDSGALYRFIDCLNDDFETRSAMLQILIRHMDESELLQNTIKRELAKLAKEVI